MDRKDIIVDEENDLLVDEFEGDFVVASSDSQHIEHILLATPGEYKQFPLLGASINAAQNGLITKALEKNIKVQLASDGYNVTSIRKNANGEIDIVI